MTTYVILLRGVTPTGKNKISMSRFRDVLEEAGFSRVRTYIQSGNALVETELSAQAVETSVRDLIRNTLGPDLSVIVRTGQELEEVVDANPFQEGYDISRVFFVLFAKSPPVEKVREILSLDLSPEKVAFDKKTAYMYIPGQYGRGTLSGGFLEKKFRIPATMRNFNTISRLAGMAREESVQEEKR